jgi:hypothetical protein
MQMTKAIFIDGENVETIIEIPLSLVVITKLLETLDRFGLDDEDHDEFGDSSWLAGISHSIYELSKIYTDLKGLNNELYDAETLDLLKEDKEKGFELRVHIFEI